MQRGPCWYLRYTHYRCFFFFHFGYSLIGTTNYASLIFHWNHWAYPHLCLNLWLVFSIFGVLPRAVREHPTPWLAQFHSQVSSLSWAVLVVHHCFFFHLHRIFSSPFPLLQAPISTLPSHSDHVAGSLIYRVNREHADWPPSPCLHLYLCFSRPILPFFHPESE